MSMGEGGTAAMRGFGERLLGALKLDASVYEEVEHDTSAFGQAATVVALASIAQGLGAYSQGGVGLTLLTLVVGFAGWFIGAGLVWLIGVKMMGCTSDYPELLRTLGFASAPSLLAVIGLLPLGEFALVLSLVVGVLLIVAWVIAARQALDVPTARAVVVCIIAYLIPRLILAALAMILLGIGLAIGSGATPGATGF
jgi:hypothetical protein